MTDDESAQATEQQGGGDGAPNAADRAKDKAEAWDQAHETMKKMEEADDPPTDLKEWPDDEAKYVTYGGGEGDHGYDEGPEAKLGPSSLERHEDGSVTIEGKEVDNPEDYKADERVEAATQSIDARKEEEQKEEEGEETDEDEDKDD
ncbi:MAG TPA: hypothetical protein VGW10_01185 [Solirubrobacteraceae bacterium]|nr:hypothetical protein [Solirubrobacteraceae bacterium]